MKNYLSKKLYVKNEDKLVYEISSYNVYPDCINYDLELVCGWDYINPDHNDVQVWCPADRFIEDVQYEDVIQYFIVESLKECLEENGYTILEENPLIN